MYLIIRIELFRKKPTFNLTESNLLLLTMKKFTFLPLSIVFISISTLFSQNTIKSASDFYRTDVIQEAEILFDTENWDYILDSLRVNGDQYLVANIRINDQFLKEVGVRYAGGKSYQKEAKRNGFEISGR